MSKSLSSDLRADIEDFIATDEADAFFCNSLKEVKELIIYGFTALKDYTDDELVQVLKERFIDSEPNPDPLAEELYKRACKELSIADYLQ